MTRLSRPSAAPEREPLEVGAALKGGAWAIARFEGAEGRMLRYLATGRAGRRAELKEYFPPGWTRGHDAERDRELAAYCRGGYELALEMEGNPYLTRVLDVFEENRTFFVLQERADGPSVGERLRHSGPLPMKEALVLIGQAGAGLHALHRQGLLLRGMTPDHIRLADGRAQIAEYGLLTPFPEVRRFGQKSLANPAFAPLELLSIFPSYGPETDIYGLAATLYTLLAGRPAPPASRRVATPSLPPSPKIPEALLAALQRAMAVRAKDRTPSVDAFFDDLDRAIRRRDHPA